jgi:hypothetical protein
MIVPKMSTQGVDHLRGHLKGRDPGPGNRRHEIEFEQPHEASV